MNTKHAVTEDALDIGATYCISLQKSRTLYDKSVTFVFVVILELHMHK